MKKFNKISKIYEKFGKINSIEKKKSKFSVKSGNLKNGNCGNKNKLEKFF